jgi:hypothetical protein
MKIIGLVGFKGSGKDTASQPLLQLGYQKTSFAGVLKDCCTAIFGWDRDMLEGLTGEDRLKREETDLWWAEKLKRPGFSPRRAFQIFGTDVVRSHFDTNIWIYAVQHQILQQGGDWVITDCRFPNELQMIKDFGGTIIRVKRGPEPEWFETAKLANWPDKSGQNEDYYHEMVTTYNNIHVSEWAWIGSNLIDAEVANDCSTEELHQRVMQYVNRT